MNTRLSNTIRCRTYESYGTVFVENLNAKIYEDGRSTTHDELSQLLPRVPKRGEFKLTVRTAANGRYFVHDTYAKRVTLAGVEYPWTRKSATFCYLPPAFCGRRVNITITRVPR